MEVHCVLQKAQLYNEPKEERVIFLKEEVILKKEINKFLTVEKMTVLHQHARTEE